MKNWFLTHFSFSRKEIQGIAFLTFVVIIVWLTPWAYQLIAAKGTDADFALRKQEIINFVKQNQNIQTAASVSFEGRDEPDYFAFDPNTLSSEEGERLGLSAAQVRVIHNYRKSGGRFYKKEDFARIYSISEEEYKQLAPYIQIRSTEVLTDTPVVSDRKHPVTSQKLQKDIMINLNKTDSIELLDLYGIGPAFASRIVKYRDLLGGFHHKDQLLEVYGMDVERFEGFKENVFVNPGEVQMIPINSIGYRELLKHPYITPRQANTVVQYRNQHGNYHEPADLLKIEILDEEFLRKIAPYLSFRDELLNHADNRDEPPRNNP